MKKLCVLLSLMLLFLCSCNKTDTNKSYDNFCTLKITCEDVLIHEAATEALLNELPKGGIIFNGNVGFDAGESAFDVIKRIAISQKIHLDFSKAPASETYYIKGISNLYEKDFGEFSGWLYAVNGESPTVSANQFKVSDGDEIIFYYSCDMLESIGS